MARQERYYYKNDPKYSNKEREIIDKILRKEDIVTSIFVPIISFLFIAMVPCLILDIVFSLKGLEIAFYILLCLFFITLFLWIFFYFKVSQERARIMSEIEKDKVKKAH